MMYGRNGKRTLAVAALIGMTLAVGGYSGPSWADDGPVTLVLGHSQWLDTSRGDGLWAAMKKFETAQSDIKIEKESIPGSDIATKLTTELGAGAGPDIFMIQDNVFEQFAAAGFLADLTDVTKGANLNSTGDGAIKNGRRLAVAWQRAPYGFLYNKALLDKAGVTVPTTPDELIAAAKAVEAKTGAYGFGDESMAANPNTYTQRIDIWTFGMGGSWTDDKGNLTIDSPENIAGIKAFAKVQTSGIMHDDDMKTMRAKFDQGKIAMMSEIGGGAIIAVQAGVIAPQDIRSAPEPVPYPTFHQELYVGVNKNSKHLKQALEFIKWFIGPDAQKALRDASGPDQLATDVPIDPAYAAANPWAEGFYKIGETTRSTLIKGHEVDTWPIMQIIIQHVQDVVVSGTPAEQALKAAQAEAEALVN